MSRHIVATRLCRTDSQIKVLKDFRRPILVFFWSSSQNWSRRPLDTLETKEIILKWSKRDDSALEQDIWVSWLVNREMWIFSSCKLTAITKIGFQTDNIDS